MKIDLNTSLKNNIHENSLTKMIDNPLEKKTLDSYDGLYKNEKFLKKIVLMHAKESS